LCDVLCTSVGDFSQLLKLTIDGRVKLSELSNQ